MTEECKFEIKPADALQKLKRGNAAYLDGDPPSRCDDDRKRREGQRDKQKPFAVIVSCSDSRVPPERVFGYGLGDLFTVRIAGNVVDAHALGSIEYAVIKLRVPLVVVMGHEQCGAVVAAVEVVTKDASFPGAIGKLIEPIIPSVRHIQHGKKAGEAWDKIDDTAAAVRENVRRVAAALRDKPNEVLGPHLKDARLAIVGAYYDLDTGKVDFFDTIGVAAASRKVARVASKSRSPKK